MGIVAVILSISGLAAAAEDSDLSKETTECLKCHDKPGQEKKLENGETLSLHVSTKAFVESMHKTTDCEDCHDIDSDTHGKEKASIASLRAYAISLGGSCRECHKQNFKAYGDGLHAALVKDGDDKAPLCSDCHAVHTLLSVKIAQPITATPCAKCHEDIFKAYAKDVHGLKRVAEGKKAPICANCHKAHENQAASLGSGIKDACVTCHKDAFAKHTEWLPNAALHFEAISCPVCHAPDARRQVNLRLYDGVDKHQILEKTGVPQFERLTKAADANDTGLDERALWSMLSEFSRNEGDEHTVLNGRLEVRSGVEAHQLSDKSKAISDCNICHRKGADAFQSVSLTIAGPDGRPIRHAVKKDVLNSLLATKTVRGFYAIGSTRIKLLDYALILVVLGALSFPVGHITIRWLFRKVREKHEAEMAAAGPKTHDQTKSVDRSIDRNTDNR